MYPGCPACEAAAVPLRCAPSPAGHVWEGRGPRWRKKGLPCVGPVLLIQAQWAWARVHREGSSAIPGRGSCPSCLPHHPPFTPLPTPQPSCWPWSPATPALGLPPPLGAEWLPGSRPSVPPQAGAPLPARCVLSSACRAFQQWVPTLRMGALACLFSGSRFSAVSSVLNKAWRGHLPVERLYDGSYSHGPS